MFPTKHVLKTAFKTSSPVTFQAASQIRVTTLSYIMLYPALTDFVDGINEFSHDLHFAYIFVFISRLWSDGCLNWDVL